MPRSKPKCDGPARRHPLSCAAENEATGGKHTPFQRNTQPGSSASEKLAIETLQARISVLKGRRSHDRSLADVRLPKTRKANRASPAARARSVAASSYARAS